MSAPAVLDPSQYTLSVAGFNITGYGPGTFITVTRDEESFRDQAGADGEVARIRNKDKRGTIKVSLMQTSASNDILAALAAADDIGGAGSGSVLLKDNSPSGRMIIQSETGWVKKQPEVQLGDEVQIREWEIRCSRLEMFVGGNS